jgi:hypothetical protein
VTGFDISHVILGFAFVEIVGAYILDRPSRHKTSMVDLSCKFPVFATATGTVIDPFLSFHPPGEIDTRLLEMEGRGRAVVDPDGDLLVFGPLRDPHRHETRIGCSLKKLIREIAVPRAEESDFLRFMAGILPARDANNRKLWEKGEAFALAGLLWC